MKSESESKPDIVYDLIEARQWFLEHPNLSVICVRRSDAQEKTCSNLEEARAFFPVKKDGVGTY